jgi:hypothetical protein
MDAEPHLHDHRRAAPLPGGDGLMHWLSLLRGIGIVLLIVVVAGIIAYIGDRVGHQVGRKRLTIFNIRPRYTSTIIAVGTGMIIALLLTLVAIFASNQVQTAFFRLGEINAEIQKAQAQARELQQKVTSSHVVVNVDQLMSTQVGRIPVNSPAGLRRDIVQNYYEQTVSYVNRQFARQPFNLKKFAPPSNLAKMVDSIANSPQMEAWASQGDVLLIASADQNLFPGDQIHFGITAVPDRLLIPGGRPIASILIPAGKNSSASLAASQLLTQWVPREMLNAGMPIQFATYVVPQRSFPDVKEMQTMLNQSKGTYIMTAFASQDIYPHTFAVPVVVTLQKAPAQ